MVPRSCSNRNGPPCTLPSPTQPRRVNGGDAFCPSGRFCLNAPGLACFRMPDHVVGSGLSNSTPRAIGFLLIRVLQLTPDPVTGEFEAFPTPCTLVRQFRMLPYNVTAQMLTTHRFSQLRSQILRIPRLLTSDRPSSTVAYRIADRPSKNRTRIRWPALLKILSQPEGRLATASAHCL